MSKINISEYDYPPTDKQLAFIAGIEEELGVVFDGTTRQEASDFIQEWIDDYNWYMGL